MKHFVWWRPFPHSLEDRGRFRPLLVGPDACNHFQFLACSTGYMTRAAIAAPTRKKTPNRREGRESREIQSWRRCEEIDLDRGSDIHLPFRPTVFSRTLRSGDLLSSSLSSRTLRTPRHGLFLRVQSAHGRNQNGRRLQHLTTIALVIRPGVHSRLADGFIFKPHLPAASVCLNRIVELRFRRLSIHNLRTRWT